MDKMIAYVYIRFVLFFLVLSRNGKEDHMSIENALAVRVCEADGCTEPGLTVWLDCGSGDAASEYCYCETHLYAMGWCPGCLRFMGGLEEFDYSATGYCDDCSEENDLYDHGDFEYDAYF